MISKMIVSLGKSLFCLLLVVGLSVGIGTKQVQAVCYSSGQHTCSTCCSRVQTVYSDQCICGPTVPTVAPTKVPTKAPTAIPTKVPTKVPTSTLNECNRLGYTCAASACGVSPYDSYVEVGYSCNATDPKWRCCMKLPSTPVPSPTSAPQKTCNWWMNTMQPNTTNCYNTFLNLNGSDRVTCNGATGNTTNIHFTNLNCVASATTPTPTQSSGIYLGAPCNASVNTSKKCLNDVLVKCSVNYGTEDRWVEDTNCGMQGLICNEAGQKCGVTSPTSTTKPTATNTPKLSPSVTPIFGSCTGGKIGYSCNGNISRFCNGSNMMWEPTAEVNCGSVGCNSANGLCNPKPTPTPAKVGCTCGSDGKWFREPGAVQCSDLAVGRPCVAPTVAPNQCPISNNYCMIDSYGGQCPGGRPVYGGKCQYQSLGGLGGTVNGICCYESGTVLPNTTPRVSIPTSTSTPRPTTPLDPRGGNNQLCLSNGMCNSGYTPSFQTGVCVCHPTITGAPTSTPRPTTPSDPRGGNNQLCLSNGMCNSGYTPSFQTGVCVCHPTITSAPTSTPRPTTPSDPRGGNNQLCLSNATCNSGFTPSFQTGTCVCHPTITGATAVPTLTVCNQSVIGRCGSAGKCSLDTQRCVMNQASQKFECSYDSTCTNLPTPTSKPDECSGETIYSCGYIPGCKWDSSGAGRCVSYTPQPSPTGIFNKFFCDTVTHKCLSERATGYSNVNDCEKACGIPTSAPTVTPNPSTCNQSVIGRCGSAGKCSLETQRCVMNQASQKFECSYDSTCTNPPPATSTPKPNVGGPQATATDVPVVNPPVPGMCTECPRQFKCYKSGTEYKWFVDGYVMQGFDLVGGDEAITCGNVPVPTYLGKVKGDATCDGSINVADYALWHKEFYDGDAGDVSSDSWHADFTGPNGVCDGRVDINDYSLWHKYFYELMGNN